MMQFGIRILDGSTQSLERARLGLPCLGLLNSSAALAPPPARKVHCPQQKSSAFLKGESFVGARFYFAILQSRSHGLIASSAFREAHLAP